MAASPRLFLVSDLHVNAAENWMWLEQLSNTAFKEDALIIAGDVCEDFDTLKEALTMLCGKFSKVWYTPGNHDLWLSPEDAEAGTSMAKLEDILGICEQLGVATTLGRFGDAAEGKGVWVWPFLSFHHQGFDTEPDVQGWDVPRAEDVMLDYRQCAWPDPLSMLDDSVARAVDEANERLCPPPAEVLEAFLQRDPRAEPLVTVSHFLPRQELLPEKRFLFLPVLPKASGSRFLGERIASLRPQVHCFGHTHFAWDMILAIESDSAPSPHQIRFIQAALSNPSERLSRWHTLSIGNFGRAGPLLIWSANEGIVPKMHCRWSGYYEHHERVTQLDGQTEFQMARYAARFARTDKRAEVIDPDFSHEGDGASSGVRMRTSDPALAEPESLLEGSDGGTASPRGSSSWWPKGVWRTGANPL